MPIHLSKDLERFVHDAVRSGLYASDDDVIRDALMQLKKTMPEGKQTPGKIPNRTKPTRPKKQPRTEAEMLQQMLADGLITRLPDRDADVDDEDDEPVVIEGEPLSETIIRERR
jgi:Arc/MetJ-type ribon-helix-helix transcriptional regulator